MSEAKLFIRTPPKPVLRKLQEENLEKRSKLVWRFIEKRDLLTVNRLAQKVGYDKGNFCKLFRGKKKMKQALLLKVEKELRPYGF